MHIPDGYISPAVSIPAIGVMIPILGIALKKVKKTLSIRYTPFIALCSAFSFIVMLFNVPVFGGTTVHAIGAVFIAIILGPWAACLSVSTVLIIQALVFGDGGVLALGINCINMAVVMPFIGYAVYRIIAGRNRINSKRGITGAFIGSYVGINFAALFAAVELGVQPLLFKAADGTPLYCPYPLSVSVPAMMFAHILVAGPIEAIFTAAAIGFVVKFSPDILQIRSNDEQTGRKNIKPVIIILILLIVITPLGLLAKGTAWGEWSTDEIKDRIGFIPKGIASLSCLWKTVFQDYSLSGKSTGVTYMLSAALGVILIVLISVLSSKLMLHFKREDKK